jgi:hypothetical protein
MKKRVNHKITGKRLKKRKFGGANAAGCVVAFFIDTFPPEA